MSIITRFAPSPTGPLHIGGARTALFNYLHAKKNNGKFRVRIEDTDKDRNSEQSSKSILSGLEWLGLEIDDKVVYQSNNKKEHLEVAKSLLSKGLAYKCFHNKEFIQKFKSSKKRFQSEWRERQNNLPRNQDYCIRIKSPLEISHTLNDRIQGKVSVKANEIDDYIIVRSDGSPTFLLSSAVDDLQMNVSDIIRGDDHLTNSFRQKIIFDFLDYKPNFAHISLIHNENNQKMSKRDNPVSILQYQANGFLPEALINYMVRLGWSFGDQEIFSMDFIKQNFTIDKLGKSPAKFDNKKLNFLNNFYIKEMPNEKILKYLINNSQEVEKFDFVSKKDLLELIGLYKDRSSSINDIKSDIIKLSSIRTSFRKDEQIILEGFKKYKKIFGDKFSNIIEWDDLHIEKTIKDIVKQYDISFKSIAQPLRLLITGDTFGPSIYKIIRILGNDEILRRINR